MTDQEEIIQYTKTQNICISFGCISFFPLMYLVGKPILSWIA